MNTAHKVAVVLALAVSLVRSEISRADVLTDTEIAVLPPYCLARLGKDPAGRDGWEQRMGPKQFIHLHHYCFGLGYLSRARATMSNKDRKFFLHRAIANFNYVIKNWPESFALRPQAQSLKSQAEISLSQEEALGKVKK